MFRTGWDVDHLWVEEKWNDEIRMTNSAREQDAGFRDRIGEAHTRVAVSGARL
jgi:hypothetical protein